MILDAAAICRADPLCPAENVAANWPVLVAAFAAVGLEGPMIEVALAGTVIVETGHRFRPLRELAPRGVDPIAYFNGKYDGRHDLGNTTPGDGFLFRGGGVIQETGRGGYAAIGREIGIPLEAHPERILEIAVSAAAAAAFFRDKGIGPLAEARDWVGVRRKVQGGTGGLALFLTSVGAVSGQLPSTQAPPAEDPHPFSLLGLAIAAAGGLHPGPAYAFGYDPLTASPA